MKETIKQTAEAYAAASLAEAQDLLRTLGKIPAPSHQEDLRAAFCRDWFLAQGAADVTIDPAKNVIMKLGPQDGDLTVFQAHMDVVFPDTEPLSMREENGRLFAPGIGDDTANLVNLMLAARYFLQSGLTPRHGFLIAANSCEEGLGNLDGTKEIFKTYGDRIKAFYSFDCYVPECCDGAVGSWRYKITCKVQGGHSYADFGRPNAIAILCRLVDTLYRQETPKDAWTTYNVGRIEGGTTVNSIAQEASMLYEFRSSSQACLETMEQQFRACLASCENLGGALTVELLGVRPGNGPVDPEALRTFTARSDEAIHAVTGCSPRHMPASTDSNIPLSLGIAANTIGTVRGGGAHTREEWVELDSLREGMAIILSLMLEQAVS